MSLQWSRLWRSSGLRLAIAAFIVYNVNLRPISSADTFPTRYLPIALLTGEWVYLDDFKFLFDSRYPLPGDENSGIPYYLQHRRGHYLSTYPVMPAILATPVYALPVALGLTRSASQERGTFSRTEIVGTMLGKVAAAAVTALSVWLVFAMLQHFVDRRGALWLSLTYAFATSAWSVSSQGLWQTSFSGPLLGAAFFFLVRARDSDGRRDVVWAGVMLAFAVACRPTAGIFALLYTAYVFARHRRHFAAYLVVPVIVGALLVSYNLYYFGNLMGGYTGAYVAKYIVTPGQVALGTYGLLLSANRGMLIFSPVLIFAFVGMTQAIVRRRDWLLITTAVGIVATILFYSTFGAWYGTFSFSYRYLADLLPLLMVFIATTWDWIAQSPWRVAGFASLAVVSVAIQVVGSFFYPCGWYQSPERDPANLARIFSWRDLEVVQCVRRGPVYPDALRLLSGRSGDAGS